MMSKQPATQPLKRTYEVRLSDVDTTDRELKRSRAGLVREARRELSFMLPPNVRRHIYSEAN